MERVLVNRNDIRLLRCDEEGISREEILRTVLAIALDVPTAARCAGLTTDGPVTRWPSTLYRLLARAAIGSPPVWGRCARALDRALARTIAQYQHHAPAELVNTFLDGRESLTGEELATLLWCLIRKRSPGCDLVAERLGLELEVVAARRLHGPN